MTEQEKKEFRFLIETTIELMIGIIIAFGIALGIVSLIN